MEQNMKKFAYTNDCRFEIIKMKFERIYNVKNLGFDQNLKSVVNEQPS